MRCPSCRVAVWSYYSSLDTKMAFVRVGTLDDPDACPPGVHIFTQSKRPWVVLPDDVEQYPVFYDNGDRIRMFGAARMERFRKLT